jgi:hypothetical protein
MTLEEEIKTLSDELLTAVIGDEHYRAGIIEFIKTAAEDKDVDTLRVYRNLIAHESFTPASLTMKYANYAMIVLRDLGHRDTASILTPDILHSFETVIRARQEALGDRGWIMGDGNNKLLVELIERPESEPVLIHLLQDRRITDVDQLLIQTAESLKVTLPLHKGAL